MRTASASVDGYVGRHGGRGLASSGGMIGARARELYERRAKERQATTRKKGNQPVPANLPERDKGDARDQAAAAVNVSGRTIDYATKVLTSGVPELVQAVDGGHGSV